MRRQLTTRSKARGLGSAITNDDAGKSFLHCAKPQADIKGQHVQGRAAIDPSQPTPHRAVICPIWVNEKAEQLAANNFALPHGVKASASLSKLVFFSERSTSGHGYPATEIPEAPHGCSRLAGAAGPDETATPAGRHARRLRASMERVQNDS
jgi:hypothetical protein